MAENSIKQSTPSTPSLVEGVAVHPMYRYLFPPPVVRGTSGAGWSERSARMAYHDGGEAVVGVSQPLDRLEKRGSAEGQRDVVEAFPKGRRH